MSPIEANEALAPGHGIAVYRLRETAICDYCLARARESEAAASIGEHSTVRRLTGAISFHRAY
jgi:hypothetical protein